MTTALVVIGAFCLLLGGGGIGAATVFWLFARDKTVVRLHDGEVIVKRDDLAELVKRAKVRDRARNGLVDTQDDTDEG